MKKSVTRKGFIAFAAAAVLAIALAGCGSSGGGAADTSGSADTSAAPAAASASGLRFVTGGEHHAAAHDDGPTPQSWIVTLLDGGVERVEVGVQDGGSGSAGHS